MAVNEDLAQRLEFLGITPGEADRLRALEPLLEEASEPLASSFYRHLLFFPETRRLLKDPECRARLLEKQRDYLRSLSIAPLDEDYVEDRRRIGVVHEELGLPAGWYLGAYAHLFSPLAFLIEDAVHGDMVEFRLVLVALLRRVLLDAQLSVEAHIHRREQRLEFLNEELARSQHELGRALDEQRAGRSRPAQGERSTDSRPAARADVEGVAQEIDRQVDSILAHVETLERYAPYVPTLRESASLIRERATRIAEQVWTLRASDGRAESL